MFQHKIVAIIARTKAFLFENSGTRDEESEEMSDFLSCYSQQSLSAENRVYVERLEGLIELDGRENCNELKVGNVKS